MRLQTTFLLLSLLTFMAPVSAQEGPKVGLVLSGGGAKGMAHIGVLKVLEGVGIVPDYITGTSMGAVVGGLYAIGYTADELEEIATTATWDVILGNRTSLRNISIEHKRYYDRYQLVLPVDGLSVGLPRGVIEGQELGELLIRLTAPVHHIDDFDDLPRPFRCIGADIATGEKVVLKDGFLASAIRASMAIPTVFTPVEIDGRLLVDGGLVHNFPVQEVIEMGADIVIGVSVSDSLVDADDLNSLIDILTQATFIASIKATDEQKQYVDYFIQPSMKPYTAADFSDADSIIARGERAAGNMFATLKHLADSLKELRTFEPIQKPEVSNSIVVGAINVNGNHAISEELILGKLNIKTGDTCSHEQLKKCVDAVYGTLNFDRVTYELTPSEEGTEVGISIHESPPGRASFDLHFDTENGVGIYTTFQYRNLGLKKSRLTLEADVAETPYFHADYFLYLGKQQLVALSVGTKFFQDDISVFDVNQQQRIAEFKNRLWHTYARIQSANNQDRAFGLLLFAEQNYLKPSVIDTSYDNFDKLRYSNIGVRPFYFVNTLDRRTLTRQGHFLRITGTLNFNMAATLTNPDVTADIDYVFWSLGAEYRKYFPITRRFNIEMTHMIRLTNLESSGVNVSDYSFVGGYRPNFINTTSFWGADKYQFQLTSFYKGSVSFRYEVVHNLYLTAGINYLETEYPMRWMGENTFAIVDAGNQFRRLSWMGGVIFSSFLGPIKFYLTRDVDGNELKPWLSVGHNLRNEDHP